MNRNEMEKTVRGYLAGHLNCRAEDFLREHTVFAVNDDKDYPFLEICTMGAATIVSASGPLMDKVKKLLDNRNRDEMFECPFIYGQSIFYIPDNKSLHRQPFDREYDYVLAEGEDIRKLKDIKGFENSLTFDEDGTPSACIVLYAMKDGEIIALAGASKESDRMWEVGIDVMPCFRKKGLASILVSNLACTILEKDIVPFYCASTTNVGSQAVAHRSGFIPCWVSTYRNVLDGSSVYQNILESLKL